MNTNFLSTVVSAAALLPLAALVPPDFAQAASYSITDLGITFLPSGVNDSGQASGSVNPPIAQAGLYGGGTVTNLGIIVLPGGNGGESEGKGINASGQVVGYAVGNVGPTVYYHAFINTAGSMFDVGALAPPGMNTFGLGINDGGQIVGYLESPTLEQTAYRYSGGTVNDLGTLPGGDTSQAHAINSGGQVVGFSNAADGDVHAFSYSAGVMTNLGALSGGNFSEAFGINDSGQIVGLSNAADGYQHPFLYDGGIMQELSLPPSAVSGYATAINDSGQVVGNSNAGAFLHSGGVTQTLNSLLDPLSGWALTFASSISDNGYIVGQGTIGGENHGFLLTPVPEPNALVLAALGLVGLAAWGWRRKR
jgi:probable HAF family extracellular repeat protein